MLVEKIRVCDSSSSVQGLIEREKLWIKSKRQRKIRKHFNNMVRYSTFHGLQFCFKKENPLRRMLWCMLLLVCNGLLIQKMFESTKNYLDYPFSTAKSVKYNQTLAFPAVSLCNLNDMRHSRMLGTKLHEAILRRDQNISSQLSGDEYKETIRQANHRIEDMLFDCSMDGKKCSSRDFSKFYHKQGDKCFTFNSGAPGFKFVQTNKIGPQHALELTINIEFWDYYDDAVQSGVHLILHGQEETPVTMLGEMVSPGYITYVEVKKQKVSNGLHLKLGRGNRRGHGPHVLADRTKLPLPNQCFQSFDCSWEWSYAPFWSAPNFSVSFYVPDLKDNVYEFCKWSCSYGW